MAKGFIKSIKQIFHPTKFPQKTQYKINYAFTIGGVDYFEMDDIFNLPYKRGMAAMSVYVELQMKCSHDFLKAHTEACNNILSAPKFNMDSALQLKKLNDQIMERLKWVSDIDLAYKLASVVFFDKSENPEGYDGKYNFEKVQKWKQAEGAQDFFLRQPLQRLIPFSKDFATNIQIYSKVTEEMTKQHLDNIYLNLSETQRKHLKIKSSKSFAEVTQQN